MSDTMRDAFEAWAKSEGFDTTNFRGEYFAPATEGAWAAWQAQSQPAPPVPANVQEIMRLMNPYVRACAGFDASIDELDDAKAEIAEAFKPLEAALTALVDERDRLKFELDGVRAMRGPEWVSVDEKLPGPGVIVLAHFVNRLGKGRTVRAHHAPKHTIEASHWDEDVETDDTDDGSFEPEGWYEDPAVGETLAFIGEQSDGKVTHWMPLPPPPTHGIEPEQGESHAK